VREDKEAVLTGLAAARDGYTVSECEWGSTHSGDWPTARRLRIEPLAAPYEGQMALLDTNTNQDGLVFTLQGWTRPKPFTAMIRGAASLTDLGIGASAPKDYTQRLEAINSEARSLDGTSIPITILKAKGLKSGPDTLAIVMAYGAYGMVITSPRSIRCGWMGGSRHLFVLAGIRGGGEKGDAWRLAGKVKTNTGESRISLRRLMHSSINTTPLAGT